MKYLLFGCSLLVGCNTAEPPTYAEVQSIFNNRCSGGTCHIGDPSQAAGLDLEILVSYDSLVNVSSLQNPAKRLVVPGRSAESYLFCKIDHGCGPIVGQRMPLENPLTRDELDTIRGWIDAGAQETLDNTPPSFEGAQAATIASATSINLFWNPASDDFTSSDQIAYQIFDASSSGAFNFAAPTATTAPGATSFEAQNLQTGVERFFVVRATDAFGNTDANTVERSATPLDGSNDFDPPSFAGLLSATAISPSSISLSWDAATDNIAPSNQISYLIFQANTSGAQNFASPTFTTLPGQTSFEVTGLAADTTRFFVVRARDPFGNTEENSIEQSATTLGTSVSFAANVAPIFTTGQTCTGAACHDATAPARGLDLTSAARAFADLVNINSSQCNTTKLVAPNNPDNSYLIHKLQGDGPCFSGTVMPKVGAELSAAQISIIQTWIAEGALNN